MSGPIHVVLVLRDLFVEHSVRQMLFVLQREVNLAVLPLLVWVSVFK